MSSKVPARPSRSAGKSATREALLHAAMELFREQGLDGPSLDSICERAGKTRGAFYVHFPDRDALLVAVMDRMGQLFLDAVLRSGEGDGLADLVLRFARAVPEGGFPLMQSDSAVRPHQLLQACARSAVVRERYRALLSLCAERLAAAIRRDQERGRLRGDVDAPIAARLLVAAVIGAQTLLELDSPLDLPETASMLLATLAPPRTAPQGKTAGDGRDGGGDTGGEDGSSSSRGSIRRSASTRRAGTSTRART